ncbi:MAG: LysE family translocator [Actinobacteria bacterium]|nr:MAG: LysE family translocator [Actinomycetota bacterium]
MMMQLLAAAGVLALLTITPGPDTAVVTRRSLGGGRRAALGTAAGIATGLLVWGALAVAGLAAIMAASPVLSLGLRVAGAALLVILGLQALVTRRQADVAQHPGRDASEAAYVARCRKRSSAALRGPFLSGAATNLLNPKIAVFYTAMLPTLAPPSSGTWGLGLLVLIHVSLTVVWLSAYALALHRSRRFFGQPSARQALERFTGVVLIGLAARLALTTG